MTRWRALVVCVLLAWMPAACVDRVTGLPAGVVVSVYQTRSDVPLGKFEVRVVNRSTRDLMVWRLRVDSGLFTSAAVHERGAVVPSGTTTDFKTDLPPARCDADAPSESVVTIEFAEAGTSRSVAVVADDEFHQLRDAVAGECLAGDVAGIATTEAESWKSPGRRRTPALLTIAMRPTGGDGSVVIESAEPTVLLALTDPSGSVIPSQELGVRIDKRSGSRRIHLAFIPSRCDAHALADDKRGTYFPLTVTTSERGHGGITVAAPPPMKSRIYAYVSRYCRLT